MAEEEEVVGWLVGWLGKGEEEWEGKEMGGGVREKGCVWGVGVVNTTFSLYCSLSQALVCLSRSYCSQRERPFPE